MSPLSAQKRPSLAVIKLVECVGILLGIPASQEKSKYKAPQPSNYDHTVALLDENYAGYLTEIARMRSEVLSNKVANDLFAKTLEPGFDYEQAVNDGGQLARDLFNAIQLVMMSLLADASRIPVIKTNVLVAVDGSMSSYNALDIATHIFKHGSVVAMALTVDECHDQRLTNMMKSHLHQDLVRRCKLQYKLPEHCYNVVKASAGSLAHVPAVLLDAVDAHQAHVLVYGLESDRTFGEGGDGGVPRWLVTSPDVPRGTSVLLAKKASRPRPFASLGMPRTHMIYMDNLDADILRATFMKTLLFVRPGDQVILIALVDRSSPVGDGRVDRWEMGRRAGVWVDGVQGPSSWGEPTCPGWNTEANNKTADVMRQLLISSQVEGRHRIEPRRQGYTTGAQLADCAVQEQADVLVMCRGAELEAVVETVQSAPCSVLILA